MYNNKNKTLIEMYSNYSSISPSPASAISLALIF